MKTSCLDHKSNQELVDMIMEWAVKTKPKGFRISWTMEMQRLCTSGIPLTPRQRLGLINVIVGWNVDGKRWFKKDKEQSNEHGTN